MRKILLVTVCIGDKYIKKYKSIFYSSQKTYCDKQGYDFLCITQALSPIKHPDAISFNKALVFSQKFSFKYDFVVFIDADVFITQNAPPICGILKDPNSIGMIDEYSQPSRIQRFMLQKKNGWEKSATEYYAMAGFNIDTQYVLNSGLILACPEINGQLFKEIYIQYVLKSIGNSRGFHFEQSAIGYEVQVKNKLHIINSKFNAIWAISKGCDASLTLKDFCSKNYFIHFAGMSNWSEILSIQNKI
jgi:hypothetical protein